jgi:hypothetical protein
MAATNAMTPEQIRQQNFLQRQVVIGNSIKMKQEIASITVNPANQPVLNIAPRNVGLLLGFIVEVTGEVTNGAATAATRTDFGNANMVSQFRFDDLNNYTRVQVPGWYLASLNSARQGFGYGGVYANAIPMGYGDNFPVYQGDDSIAATETSTLRQMYYMPISYSSTDLRGAIYAATVSATMNLQITLNQNPFVGASDPLTAIYSGNANGDWSDNVTVTVYQVYLDQIPRDPNTGAPILPMLDLNTVYDLKQTTFSGITSGQDFPMAYSNYRSFLSTFAVFDNGGEFNGGDDVNYLSLAAANFTNIWRVTPEIAALDARMTFMSDVPKGCYYFESRDIPVNTINFGNMELNINASTVNAGARVLVGYESFALVNQLVGATSLAGGG